MERHDIHCRARRCGRERQRWLRNECNRPRFYEPRASIKLPDDIASSPCNKRPHLNTRNVSRYMSAILRNVLLLQRNVPAAAEFYQQGLGLIVTKCTESYAELGDGLDEQGKPVDPHDAKARPRTVLALKAVGTEAFLTTGYSPFLNFTVQDMDTTVNNMLRMGAVLDGPIKYPAQGKVAAMRVPDGHMIGLYEMSDSPFAGGNVMMDMDKMEDLKKGGTD
jgi:catechol 2,3-dioxygenase-like lactoylglutathione lyase family enzyme